MAEQGLIDPRELDERLAALESGDRVSLAPTDAAVLPAGYLPSDPLVLSAGMSNEQRSGVWTIPPYLKIHAGLLMQEQGGAVSRVENVELLDTSIVDAQPASYNVQVKWRVTGTVEHWGHIHTRVNAYEALLRISRGDRAWKITGMEVGKQERVSYQLKVRKF